MRLKDLFKKKKEEVIDISLLNQKKEEKAVILQEKKIEVLETKTIEKKAITDFSTIQSNLLIIKNNFTSIYHEYFTCKIFSRVALKDSDFNAQIIEIDKYINSLKKKIFDLERNIDYFRKIYGESNDSEDNSFMNNEKDKINEFENQILISEKAIKQRFLDINNSYYGHLKISTVSVCISKDNAGLEEFYNSISECIKKYKNMTDCAENIFYSSGEFITKLVKQLVKCINLTKNEENIKKYNYSYFLKSDVIITLEIKEWIELYNKIKFAFKFISDIKKDEYLNIKEKYNYFETIYTILMMRYEVASDQGKSI